MPASVRALHITCFIVRPCSFAEPAIASAVLLRRRNVMVVVRSPSRGDKDLGAGAGRGPFNEKCSSFGDFPIYQGTKITITSG
jgi:hypothetical protein